MVVLLDEKYALNTSKKFAFTFHITHKIYILT